MEVDSPTLLEFEISVRGGAGSDLLACSIDGLRVAQSNAGTVGVSRKINPCEAPILMWEFPQRSGSARIGASQPTESSETASQTTRER